jgi:3-phosphoshikimate 1-carboxyvinyltransferase
MGADIRLKKAGKREDILIRGTKVLTGARVRSFGDHRTAMSMLIAGLAACGRTTIDDISCIDKSFPGFLAQLRKLI